MTRTLTTFLITAAAMLLGSGAVSAGETGWVAADDYLRSRVIVASEAMADGQVLLGWEAELADGWKTYWRSPGEAGLPVEVHVNGEPVELLYPLPERFDFYGIETYGYKSSVTLPFYVPRATLDSGADVDVNFMVCNDICIRLTAEFDVNAAVAGQSTPLVDIRLASWMKKVPVRGESVAGLQVQSVKVTGLPGRQRLIVDYSGDRQLTASDLLVESPTGTAFGRPKVRLLGDGTRARAVIPAIMRDKVDLKGTTVRVTLADGAGAAIDREIALGSWAGR